MCNVHIVAVAMDGSMAYPQEATESGCFIYLHGKLEDANQYDICTFIKGTKPKENGVFDCVVHMTDGTYVPSKVYLYWDKHFENSLRGLVVSNFEDIEVIQYVAEYVKNRGEEDI